MITSITIPQAPAFFPHNCMWQLDDGRIWSTKKAAFVDEGEAKKWLAEVQLGGIPPSPVDQETRASTEAGLIYALRFYGLPLGELTPPEEAYEAERAAVDKKYSAPWDGKSGGILTTLQMTYLAAQVQGLSTATLQEEYNLALQKMGQEFDAIDQKYGV